MEIREVGPAHANVIHGLMAQLASAEGSILSATPQAIADAMRDGRCALRCWLATMDRDAVGVAIGVRSYAASAGKPTFRLLNLVVEADQRRQGIGEALLAAVESALDVDIEWLDFVVRRNNQVARRFYTGLGCFQRPEWEVWRKDRLVYGHDAAVHSGNG